MLQEAVNSMNITDSQEQDVSGSGSRTAPDLIKALTRHWMLVTVCLAIASGLGALYYVSATRVYSATATVVVETKHAPIFGDGMNAPSSPSSWLSQANVHKTFLESQLIVERAVKLHQLEKLPSVVEASRKADGNFDPVRWIQNSLYVETAEDFTPIFLVSYSGTNPADCAAVANSIADAYQDYLREKSQGNSLEALQLITRAKDDLRGELSGLENQYAEFQRTAPVLWKDGVALNIHQERQFQLEQERKELLIEKSRLNARISGMNTAIAEGGKALEAVYWDALNELSSKSSRATIGGDPTNQQRHQTATALSQGLVREYLELRSREREMQERFGAGHPELTVIRARLASLGGLLGDELEVAFSEESKPLDLRETSEVYLQILKDRSAAIDSQINLLDAWFQTEEDQSGKIQTYIARDEAMRKEIERTEQLFNTVVAQLDEMSIVQDYENERISVIEPARSGKKLSPSLIKVIAFSILTGLGLGGLLALRLESRDSSFESPEDIRRTLAIPVLAQVPNLGLSKRRAKTVGSLMPELCTVHQPGSRASESFRGLRTSLYFSSVRQGLRVLQVTSPMPGDGKSTLIANLAVAIAGSGKSVVLVDADCRRPNVHRLFGQVQGRGLVDVLQGQSDMDDVIVESGVENLFLVKSGEIPKNPSELLSSQYFDQLMEELKSHFDFVLIDSPPVLAVSDGLAVSAKADGVVMVLKPTARSRFDAIRAKQALEDIDANVIGCIVNASSDGSNGSGALKNGFYGYGFGYSYRDNRESSEYYVTDDAKVASVPTGDRNGLRVP